MVVIMIDIWECYYLIYFYYIDFVYISEYELVYVYIELKEYNFI